jgi:hypothetical protein
MSILGINYSNIQPPGGVGEPSQYPYVAIRGAPIHDGESSYISKSHGRDSVVSGGGITRFLVNVSVHENCNSSSVLNLDSNQIYAPTNTPKTNFAYGAECSGVYGGTEYCPSTSKAGGVYSSPAPIVGAPIEFRRVFFRGHPANSVLGNITNDEERAYSAVFACSNPVDVTTKSLEDDACGEGLPSGTIFNPRDENVQYAGFAKEKEWDDIEIFGGGGGCKNAFSKISGQTYYIEEGYGLSGYTASGCDTLIVSGDSGIYADLKNNELTIYYTGSGNGSGNGCESFTGIYSDSGAYKASGCDSIIISGGSGIETSLYDNTLTINYTGVTGAPGDLNFLAGGCLSVSTSVSTVTYSIDKSEILSCLGYLETGFRVLVPTGSEMPTGFNDLNMCEFQMLYKCPEDDTTYITGCCVDPVGACCEAGSCSLKSSDDCAGRFWGVGTNCTDIISVEGPPDYFTNFTISELCQRGTACLYNATTYVYDCAEIAGSNIISREEYYQLLAGGNYNPDESKGGENPSIFTQGTTVCDCPTATSTSTSTTSTTSSTTTPI